MPGESCKMSGMGINQAPKGRVQNVQTQKSPELPAPGLNAQNESVFFIAGLGTPTKASQAATPICSVLMTPAHKR